MPPVPFFTIHLAEDYPYNGTDLEFANEEPLSVLAHDGTIGVYYYRELL